MSASIVEEHASAYWLPADRPVQPARSHLVAAAFAHSLPSVEPDAAAAASVVAVSAVAPG